jgi:hypothetical protein
MQLQKHNNPLPTRKQQRDMVCRKQQNPKRNNPSHSQPPPTPIPIPIPITNKVQTLTFLSKNHPTFPVPRVLTAGQIRGKTLEVWLSLSADQKKAKKKKKIADEVQFRGLLKTVKSDYMQGIDGGVCFPALILASSPYNNGCGGRFGSAEELWKAVISTLSFQLPEQVVEWLKKAIPGCGGFVLILIWGMSLLILIMVIVVAVVGWLGL